MNQKLFVRNLSWSVSEADLHDLFAQAGLVLSVKIPTRREDGKPRGFAFVEMGSPQEAAQAIAQLHGMMLHNRDLVVDYQDENRGGGSGGYSREGGSSSGMGSTPNAKLFVRNIGYEGSEQALMQVFQAAGTVVSVKIPTDRETGEPKGFAFIEMGSAQEAAQAIAQLNGTPFGMKTLAIDYQDPNRSRKAPPRQSQGGYSSRSDGYSSRRW